jgi:hypothetical protein
MEMKRFKKRLGLLAIVADLALVTTGCVEGVIDIDNDWDWDHSGKVEATAAFSRTVPLNNQTDIRITGSNGSILLWGVPGAQEVQIDAVRRVRSNTRHDAEEHLSDLRVEVRVRSHEVEVKTVQPSHTHGRTYVVDYDITVPSDLLPTIIQGNGTIRLEGLSANVDVKNGNGDVKLIDVAGSSWVAVGNGEISAWTYLPDGGKIVHTIGNGAIYLSVQPEVSAWFGAKVGNGTISVTGLDLHGMVAKPREVYGTLGAGSGLIDLSTGNGKIRVEGG